MRAAVFNKRSRLLALQAVIDREQMIKKTEAYLIPIFERWLTKAFNRFKQAGGLRRVYVDAQQVRADHSVGEKDVSPTAMRRLLAPQWRSIVGGILRRHDHHGRVVGSELLKPFHNIWWTAFHVGGTQAYEMEETLRDAVSTARKAYIPPPDERLLPDRMIFQLMPFGLSPDDPAWQTFLSRENLIRSVDLTREQFDDVLKTVAERSYIYGDSPIKTTRHILDLKIPGVSRDRAKLWARTEATVAQSDAEMASYREAGLNGKQWLTVGDSRVRVGHQINEADGVIHIDAPFSDESLDVGSGSVNPMGCRCTLAPAVVGDRPVVEGTIRPWAGSK